MARVLIIASDGTAIDHLDYAYFRMLEEGFEVTIAAPRKGQVKSSVHWGGPDTYHYCIERPGYVLPAHASFDEIDPTEYDGLLLPGGRAPEFLRNDERCVSIVRHFIESEKPVASLCHGPLLLLAAGVTGRRMACADDIAVDVTTSKNTYVENKGEIPGQPDHVVDGNIVTARGWWHYHSWVREFLNLLQERGIKLLSVPASSPSRVLILAGEHSSAGQLSYALERTLEAGHSAAVAAPEKTVLKTLIDPREEGWDPSEETPGPYTFESLGFLIPSDLAIDEVDPSEFDALLIPGGRATEYLRNIQGFRDTVRHFVERDKPIGAIAEGARLLLTAGVTGRKLTGMDMIRSEIAPDNTYVAAGDEAVRDGNIVTVSARPYYHVWMREFLPLLP
ncbi:DJ-1/PfpI family protein [Streptomyces coeruleorubidus]|uniref:DJ-1/PfpI family protein n=1 Tax=Streptomyces coeruleorubidus TaxID=116188 RepID=UPI0033F9A194